MIDLVLSFTPTSALYQQRQTSGQQPVLVPNVSGRALPVYVQPAPVNSQHQSPVQTPPSQPLNDEDISNLMEMFPNVDKDVIKSIGEANRGDKTATINSLLQLTN